MSEYLLETALLTHGLTSIGEPELLAAWSLPQARLAWLSQGEISSGDIEQYLHWRKSAPLWPRLDRARLRAARAAKGSGALTASATMQAAAWLGIPCVVSCGIGGVGPAPGQEISSDLPALAELPLTLVATSPKDVFDHAATIGWLRRSGVRLLGRESASCDGFLSVRPGIVLDGVFSGGLEPHTLLLDPIPASMRPISPQQLAAAMAEGVAAKKAGGEYHPAVNGYLSRLSRGHSDRLQLAALLRHAAWAAEI